MEFCTGNKSIDNKKRILDKFHTLETKIYIHILFVFTLNFSAVIWLFTWTTVVPVVKGVRRAKTAVEPLVLTG